MDHESIYDMGLLVYGFIFLGIIGVVIGGIEEFFQNRKKKD